MTATEASKIRRYKASLLGLWNMLHDSSLNMEHQFSNEELFSITPEHVHRYLCTKAYNKEEPNFEVDKPTHGRSSSLEFAKKAISFFMPNRLLHWNEQTRQGNPTKSSMVNNLIKRVKKDEVRKQGKASNARRAMKMNEFVFMINGFRSMPVATSRYTIAAYFIFQFHMVARLDDIMNFKVEDVTPNPDYPGTLKSKMCWSKNVMEEREAPDQIILAAQDPNFCAILALAVHLDNGIRVGKIKDDGTMFGINKSVASGALMKQIKRDDFPLYDNLPLGTHSVRKFPSTYARRNGCNRDDVDVRGRWKRMKRTVDTYIDVELPYPDAKVASALCVGGPIKYEFRKNTGLTDRWILENVGSTIATIFPDNVAIVLGKALLWGFFDEEFSKTFIDQGYVNRVKQECIRASSHVVNDNLQFLNPIKKVPLIVTGNDDALVITEFDSYDDDNNNDNSEGADGEDGNNANRRRVAVGHGVHRSNNDDNDQIKVLVSSVNSLRRQNDDLKNELIIFKESTTSMMKQMNTSIKRLSMLPVSRVMGVGRHSVTHSASSVTQYLTAGGNGITGVGAHGLSGTNNIVEANDGRGYATTLTKCPKTLYVLWQEYEFGVGGRRPARLFNATERGRVKFNYSLRKGFWQLMDRMIRNGHTFNGAIDKIYSVYDRSRSVTEILRQIRKDAKTGGHPQLAY